MPGPTPTAGSRRQRAEARLADRRRAPTRPADTPLVGVAVAVAAGALLAPAIGVVGVPATLVAAAVALGGWLAAWRGRRDGAAAAALLAAVTLGAAGWADASWRLFDAGDVGRFAPRDARPVCLDVLVTRAPTFYAADPPTPFRAIPSTARTVVEVHAERLRDGVAWRDVAGACELTVAGRLEEIAPGQRLRVFGQLRRPRPALNPGERDAAVAERAERRLATLWTEAPECVRRTGASPAPVSLGVAAVRDYATGVIDRRLAPRAAPLVRAVLLGDTSGLGEATVDSFRRTGTVHLLVVSGLHVGLVASLLPALAALGLAPRRGAWVGGLLLVGVYVLVVGAKPPAVRAGVVAAAIGVAALAGRRPVSVNSLAGAAVAVFCLAPGAWAAAGTRLSFLAAATLVGLAGWAAKRRAIALPPLERLIRSARSPGERLARRLGGWAAWGIGATVAVQLVAGPLVASEFHIVSPAAALLALPSSLLLWFVVGGGMATLALDFLGPVADFVAWVASGAAVLLGGVVTTAADVPGAGFTTAGPAPWWVAAWTGWVALAAAVAAYWPRKSGLAWRLGLAVLTAAFVGPLWQLAFPPDAVRCSFLAVGHGSATLIRPPSGGAILVDAGALGAPDRVADSIARALWAHGVHRLDALVLTHADLDHYNAVPGLLERLPIDVVYTTTLMFPSWDDPADRSGPAELRRLLDRAGVPIQPIVAGRRIDLDENTQLVVLHPDAIGLVASDNANSLVVGIEHAGRRVLLPGDLEAEGIEALLAQEPYDCDLLLAPHHGSGRSDPGGFAGWCRPEQVVVSSGEARDAARLSYTAAGAGVWNTHEHGMVTAHVSAAGVRVTPFGR